MRKPLIRERVLRKDPDVDLVALHRAAEIRQARDNDPDRLRTHMARGARYLAEATKARPGSRKELLERAIQIRDSETND